MYERFSDRARKVMLLANQAAQRLNHEWVGTEHILMGILKMDTSLALDILKHLKIDAAAVEAELNVLITPGKTMVTMGKLPQTPRAKMVIDFAMDFARTWEHTHVGTEHLLIGLAREREGIASQVLIKCGLTVDNAREALTAVIASHPKKETHAFMLTVPFWNLDASKSAVESARCVVAALAPNANNTQTDWVGGEKDTYIAALLLLKEQITKALENCN